GSRHAPVPSLRRRRHRRDRRRADHLRRPAGADGPDRAGPVPASGHAHVHRNPLAGHPGTGRVRGPPGTGDPAAEGVAAIRAHRGGGRPGMGARRHAARERAAAVRQLPRLPPGAKGRSIGVGHAGLIHTGEPRQSRGEARAGARVAPAGRVGTQSIASSTFVRLPRYSLRSRTLRARPLMMWPEKATPVSSPAMLMPPGAPPLTSISSSPQTPSPARYMPSRTSLGATSSARRRASASGSASSTLPPALMLLRASPESL